METPPRHPYPATGYDDYRYTRLYEIVSNANSAQRNSPVRYFFIVSGNVLARTLGAVPAYSDWGYGSALVGGGFRDDAIDDRTLSGDGIVLIAPLRDVLVNDNIIATGWNGVTFDVSEEGAVDGAYRNVVIEGNIISAVGD